MTIAFIVVETARVDIAIVEMICSVIEFNPEDLLSLKSIPIRVLLLPYLMWEWFEPRSLVYVAWIYVLEATSAFSVEAFHLSSVVTPMSEDEDAEGRSIGFNDALKNLFIGEVKNDSSGERGAFSCSAAMQYLLRLSLLTYYFQIG